MIHSFEDEALYINLTIMLVHGKLTWPWDIPVGKETQAEISIGVNLIYLVGGVALTLILEKNGMEIELTFSEEQLVDAR